MIMPAIAKNMPFMALVLTTCMGFSTCLAQAGIEGEGQAPRSGSIYNFGGACPSQGQWTQMALDSTKRIEGIVQSIKDDPACNGLKGKLQAAITTSAQDVQKLASNPRANRMMLDIPAEIGALKSFATSNPSDRSAVIQLMMDRAVESAQISSQISTKNVLVSRADTLNSLWDRTKRASNSSADMLSVIFNELPNLDQCVAGQDSMAQMMSAAVNVAATFASSGDNYSGKMATTIQSMLTAMKKKKYTEVLRRLNDNQFLMSMSCLIETTTEAYCSTDDSLRLMNEETRRVHSSKDVLELGKPMQKNGVTVENPFEGYYMLSTQVGNVTDWLQKVQIGVDPMLKTDASFQINTLTNVTIHIQSIKRLQGMYNSDVMSIRSYSPNRRANAAFDLLQKMVAFTRGIETEENFFLKTVRPLYLPFYLMGWPEDKIPKVVRGGEGQVPIDWDQYISANLNSLPSFKDPDKLIEVMGVQLRELIDQSSEIANSYYSNWFIVDKPALVNESVTAVRYSVIDSLRNIDQYLSRLDHKVRKYSGDPVILGTIADTRTRIGNVLKSYEELKPLSKLKAPLTEAQLLESSLSYKKVIDTVYNQFNVMLQRSGFISNRLSGFVQYDYALMLKNKVDFDPFKEELFYATGRSIYDRIVNFYYNSPIQAKNDLISAQNLNAENILAVEGLVKDNMIQQMSYLQRITDGKSVREWPMFFTNLSRLIIDSLLPRETLNGSDRKSQFQQEEPIKGWMTKTLGKLAINAPIVGVGALTPILWYRAMKYQDRYNLRVSTYASPERLEDEHHSAGRMLARLCAQSLAFSDWQAYLPYCRGTELQSFLDIDLSDEMSSAEIANAKDRQIKIRQAKLNISYDQKALEGITSTKMNLDSKQSSTVQQALAKNQTKRICAFRDWGRRNYVFWQTLLLDENRKNQ